MKKYLVYYTIDEEEKFVEIEETTLLRALQHFIRAFRFDEVRSVIKADPEA